jgi:glycosyltransferase involved in cell wall biosynthesis
VLRQDFQDWEIIVSDNASEENIEGYVCSLNEPRIKYSRSEKFLTITESWNRSVNLSSGEYVIMLGDDDILLKNYFDAANKLIEDFQEPDLIYTDSFLYAYPGVIPNFPKGVFQPFGALSGMPQRKHPFWLDLSARRGIIQETLRFNSVYSTNMQHALIRRALVEKIKRNQQFFHSPYPDVYAMSALFIEAERVLIDPRQAVVVGVTPKSHGYFAFNNKQKEAVDFLNIKNEIASIPDMHSFLLPPYNSIQTFWLAAIHLLNAHFPLAKHGLSIDFGKYRKMQIKNVFSNRFKDKELFKIEYNELLKRLSNKEKSSTLKKNIFISNIKNFTPSFIFKLYRKLKTLKKNKQKIVICTPQASFPENRFLNALEIFENIEPKF